MLQVPTRRVAELLGMAPQSRRHLLTDDRPRGRRLRSKEGKDVGRSSAGGRVRRRDLPEGDQLVGRSSPRGRSARLRVDIPQALPNATAPLAKEPDLEVVLIEGPGGRSHFMALPRHSFWGLGREELEEGLSVSTDVLVEPLIRDGLDQREPTWTRSASRSHRCS